MNQITASTSADKFVSLKVAAEGKIEGIKKETSFQVEPFKIEIRPGFNRPISRDHIEEIKESVRGGAKIKPIDVALHRTAEHTIIYMVDGEHRMWAVRELVEEFRAGLETGRDIPFMSAIEFKGGLDEQIAHMLNSGQSLGISPLVQGEKYAELLKFNWDVAKIAKRMGKSVTHVENCLSLAHANPDVRESVRSGDVAGSYAVEIIREHGDDAGKVIQEALAVAKTKGKNKVTKKTMEGAAIPRKLVGRVTASMGGLFAAMPSVTAESLAAMPAESTVAVSASLLATLMAAHEEILKLEKKAAAKGVAARKETDECAA